MFQLCEYICGNFKLLSSAKPPKYSRTVNTIFTVMDFVIPLMFLYICFMLGKLSTIPLDSEMRRYEPSIVFHSVFIAIMLIGLTLFIIFGALQDFANRQLRNVTLTIDDNGITRLGQGIRRDLFLQCNNVRVVTTYGYWDHGVRIWMKEPDKAWASKNFFLSAISKVLRVASFGLFQKEIEQPYIHILPRNLGLTTDQLVDELNQKINVAKAPNWRPDTKFGNGNYAKLPKIFTLIFLTPFVCFIVGMFFAIPSPPATNPEPVEEIIHRSDGKLVQAIGFMLFLFTGIIGFVRPLQKIFSKSKKRPNRRYSFAFITLFFLGIVLMFYGAHIRRPHIAAERGFSSYEEMREARKFGFRTGEKWQEYKAMQNGKE